MTDRYAVIGNPIAHSKSPKIHAAFAQQTGEDLEYGRILGRIEAFESDIDAFFAQGGKGLNVTVPFKEAAFRIADEVNELALTAGASNTLIKADNGQIQAANTDGIGLVRDLLENHQFDFADKSVLLLGAGGASRGVAAPLLAQKIARLTIANRTEQKAHDLAKMVEQHGATAGCGFADLAGQKFDLIINGTAAGLANQVPAVSPDCLAENAWTYDLMYGDQPTAFVRWGTENGAEKALDGLGMLVEQAAEAFFLWRGVRPDTAAVIALLRAGA